MFIKEWVENAFRKHSNIYLIRSELIRKVDNSKWEALIVRKDSFVLFRKKGTEGQQKRTSDYIHLNEIDCNYTLY